MQSNPWWRELCWKESNLSNISRLFRSVKWWQLKFHDECFKDHLGISLPLAVHKSLGQKIRLLPGNLRERCPRRFFHFRELPSLGCEGGDWVQGNPGTPLTHPLEFSADSTPGTPRWLNCEKHQGGITPQKKKHNFREITCFNQQKLFTCLAFFKLKPSSYRFILMCHDRNP